ncbi:hypothetical protein SARC_01763 [Sphaeroforma arctica JP610]|uniref:Peptidase C14 caspase domain-containing protein n=1 Tax=Sphaeroforma arctica JP610 TaxID=667725 RepID=A0A0L0GB17_9EUKA|nr:hypothetical protein SARC_01763 [Sphaeroforma arctica JP610]KNC86071.1 hypothetical protein SARC_01763 [Sphaeroforma arctica JP610]|eukprot:XP_014159973.1 hypothetical protein SARC_01763 [Sphaeroforma arctica JP610]
MPFDLGSLISAGGRVRIGGHTTEELMSTGAAHIVGSDGTTEGGASDVVQQSDLTGNKKSLFIGINYFGTKSELKGCINDVKNLREFVIDTMQFPDDKDHMRVLIDDGNGDAMPTRDAIMKHMNWLVAGAQKGDSLFFHYSGHGGTSKDKNDSDEQDGQDETLCPMDYATKGQIIDDLVHKHLVEVLPPGVRLTAIVDACHSGSVFDLAYTYNIDANNAIIEVDNKKIAMDAAKAAYAAHKKGDKMGMLKHGLKGAKAIFDELKGNNYEDKPAGGSGDGVTDARVSNKETVADVIQFSGCMDSQTSADAHIKGQATGAFSWAFIESIKSHGVGKQTYIELLTNIRQLLAGKYTQVPQMSTGYKMNMQTPFIM